MYRRADNVGITEREKKGAGDMSDALLIVAITALLACIVLLILVLTKIGEVKHVNSNVKTLGSVLAENQREMNRIQEARLGELADRFNHFELENEQKLENIRNTMANTLGEMMEDNSRQLEKMRITVDEKLQKTLDQRISESFRTVEERLEQVYKGLGEMQNLANGVGDLKKVLTNVKTRGILGEIQLGAILEQILSPEQYEENVKTRPSSNDRVEFALKLPGDDNGVVYLPIDAKFPGDAYAHLMDAYDTCDKEIITANQKALGRMILSEAKDIHEKYVEPPYTTDFAIMFLPTEGLYAEVVKLGMVEILQNRYKVNIAGPTTMAALLNSLQMGFRTLAIQKHSSEVWDTLGAVKTEFDKFENALASAQKRIEMAGKDLDTLVGTRTRAIRRTLKNVEKLPENKAVSLIDD